MTRRLDAIFFDIDDTLFSTTVFADKARRAAIDAMILYGLRAERHACLRELEEVIAEFSSNYGSHFDKVIQRLPASASAGLNKAMLVAAGVVAYHETKTRELQVYDDVYEVLRWLAATPLARGIISAGWTIKQAEKVVRLKIYEFLTPNAIYFTDEIGISKPNPKLYRRVLQDLGLEARYCMYVGDNPRNDIDPCNREGWVTVRSKRSGRFAEIQGETRPTYEIRDFYELRDILRRDFGVGAAAPAAQG
ncbi:MAG: HAD-IA family hydrolase [Planctomycetes bacterium]|nr:HAD-IA family hydrolase [Planctomycetota bacterium]